MASTCDSEYVKGLNPVARSRYHFKLSYNKGTSSLPDPYNLKGWTNNPSSWPDLTFGDLYTYLIETPRIYTKESLKAFKSLKRISLSSVAALKHCGVIQLGTISLTASLKGKEFRPRE